MKFGSGQPWSCPGSTFAERIALPKSPPDFCPKALECRWGESGGFLKPPSVVTAANSLEPAAVPTGNRDKAAASCARVAGQEGDTPFAFAARLNRAPALMNKGDPSPAGGGKSGRTPAGDEFHAGRPAVTKRGKNGVFSEEEKTCRARKGGRGTFCAEDPVAGPMLRRSRVGRLSAFFVPAPSSRAARERSPRFWGESLQGGAYRTRFPGSTR